MKTHLFATMVAWLLFANPGGNLLDLNLMRNHPHHGVADVRTEHRHSIPGLSRNGWKNRLFTTTTTGNSGRGFSYQAILRDEDGQPRTKAPIEMRFGLYPNGQATTPSWQENHMKTTDEYGQVALIIGEGMKTGGTASQFKDVDFSSAHYWLKVEVKEDGAWKEMVFYALPSVPYAEVANNASLMPSGVIIPFAGSKDKIPDGWVLCDGSTLSRSEYPALYTAIGTNWGAGDGSSTFHLPDLNGMFLRGVDYGGKHDDDRGSRFAKYTGGGTNINVGSYQGENYRSHNHNGSTESGGAHTHRILNGSTPIRWEANDRGGNDSGWSKDIVDTAHPDATRTEKTPIIMAESNGSHKHIIPKSGGNETRPDNAYVNYIIKI